MIITHTKVNNLVRQLEIDAFRITNADKLLLLGNLSNEFNTYTENERLDPRVSFPNARSIIVFGLSYNYKKAIPKENAYLLSRSSYGHDYHKVFKTKLEKLNKLLFKNSKQESKVFVDTGPLVERLLAEKSGLGFLGKNTCIINPNLGSFMFIGYIISDARSDFYDSKLNINCATCDLCEKACPNKAIKDYKMQMNACLSYITQKKGELTEFEKKNLNRYIYGCDICQEVCPYNKKAIKVYHKEFHSSDDYGLVYKEDFKLSNKEFEKNTIQWLHFGAAKKF